jgi:hypothetical protein
MPNRLTSSFSKLVVLTPCCLQTLKSLSFLKQPSILVSFLFLLLFLGWLYCLFIYLGGTGVWIQGLVLARKVLYHMNHVLCPFFKAIFWIGSSVFPWASLDCSLRNLYLLGSQDYRGEPSHSASSPRFLISHRNINRPGSRFQCVTFQKMFVLS